MNIGVLALQGAFIEHEKKVTDCGEKAFEIRCLEDIKKPFDGLIIPGGESTVMGKLLFETGLFEPIKKMIDNGLPVMGTCAGLILLAKKIDDGSKSYFNALGVSVMRNAYGRQLGSFEKETDFAGIRKINAVFIRAPKITDISSAQVLAEVNNVPVAVREKNILGLAFHPELTESGLIHDYFIKQIIKKA